MTISPTPHNLIQVHIPYLKMPQIHQRLTTVFSPVKLLASGAHSHHVQVSSNVHYFGTKQLMPANVETVIHIEMSFGFSERTSLR